MQLHLKQRIHSWTCSTAIATSAGSRRSQRPTGYETNTANRVSRWPAACGAASANERTRIPPGSRGNIPRRNPPNRLDSPTFMPSAAAGRPIFLPRTAEGPWVLIPTADAPSFVGIVQLLKRNPCLRSLGSPYIFLPRWAVLWLCGYLLLPSRKPLFNESPSWGMSAGFRFKLRQASRYLRRP